MTFSLRKQLEGEQRWETNNGNSLETRGHLHRLEHQVSSGHNCEFRIQNDNYGDYFDNCDNYFDLHLLEHQVYSCEAQFGHLFGIVRKEEDLAIKQQQQQQYFLQDLFYLLPYHHLEFPPSLKKLIIIDVDLEFSVDILRLYKYYLKFQFPNSVQPIPANSWKILYVKNWSLEWFLQLSGTFPSFLQVRFSPVGSPSPHSTLASLKNTGMKRHKNRNIKFIHWKLLYPGKVILTALLANPVDSRWYFRWQWQKWWC